MGFECIENSDSHCIRQPVRKSSLVFLVRVYKMFTSYERSNFKSLFSQHSPERQLKILLEPFSVLKNCVSSKM